jgi:hypothetical protein
MPLRPRAFGDIRETPRERPILQEFSRTRGRRVGTPAGTPGKRTKHATARCLPLPCRRSGFLARYTRSAVSRELNLGMQTVRRSANAACAEELLGKTENRATSLDPWTDVIN